MDILSELHKIEQNKNVEILFACESGSRAWGFPSPDSDFDIRFLYKHDLDFYLSTLGQEDAISLPINALEDISGWDIRKAVILLRKSNVPLLEWLQSPIIYKQNDSFYSTFKPLALQFFSPVAGFYHYHHMALKYEELILGNDYKLKHLFYALRTTFAARWIVKFQSFPPVEFMKLLEGLELDILVKEEILILKDLKLHKEESYRHASSQNIVFTLKTYMQQNTFDSATLRTAEADVKALDKFFIDLIKA